MVLSDYSLRKSLVLLTRPHSSSRLGTLDCSYSMRYNTLPTLITICKGYCEQTQIQTESRIRSKEYLCYTNIHQLSRKSTSKLCAIIKNFRCVDSGSNDVGILGRWKLDITNRSDSYLRYHRHTAQGSCRESGSQQAQ